MKITALTENTTENSEYLCEHGLSLYIETECHKILFDMGQTDKFSLNAEKMGINLSGVDVAVLSHGHYDHGGGLEKFLEINKTAPVYISRYAFGEHYNGSEKYIGLDCRLMNSDRLIYTDDVCLIDEGITLYSCNDKNSRYNLGSFGLTILKNGEYVPDDFLHEQYLLICEKDRKILISGCSHKGILDIAEWFEPDVLVGGFHFSKMPLDDTLKTYAEKLASFDTQFYTCHCTGQAQYEYMKKYINRLGYISTGETLNF